MLEEHAVLHRSKSRFCCPEDHCPAFIDTKRRPDDDRLQMTTLDLEAQSATRANPRIPSPRERLLPLAPSLEHRRLQCYALLMATDSLALAGSMLGVGSALHGSLSMAFQHLLLLLPFYLIGAPASTPIRCPRSHPSDSAAAGP
jgi:hypothetical protein